MGCGCNKTKINTTKKQPAVFVVKSNNLGKLIKEQYEKFVAKKLTKK